MLESCTSENLFEIRALSSEEDYQNAVQSSKLLLVLASTVVLGFGPRWDP
jgi:hypothetical protein